MNFFYSLLSERPLWWQIVLSIAFIAFLSIAFSLLYVRLKKDNSFYRDIPITLMIFPIVVCATVIVTSFLVFEFSGTTQEIKYYRAGIALFAAVILIRFRSQQRTLEDLTYVFFMTACGFVVGLGYILFALLIYIVVVVLLIMIHIFSFPESFNKQQSLKITVPEDLNFDNAFDDILDKYTIKHHLSSIKSSDMGTMFVLVYDVVLKPDVSKKQMIDEIRVKNSNLNVIIVAKKFLDEK